MKSLRHRKSPWMLYETEVPHSRFCDPARGVSPAETLSPEHLQLLRNAFTCSEADGQRQETRLNGGSRGDREERGMTFEEFRDVLRSVIGPDVEETWVERFFNEVDISCTGQVTWQQLCSYLLLEYTERERASTPTPALLDAQAQIRHCSHNKREPTVRVVAVPQPPPLRYVSVSKGGQITVWNSSLHILRTLGLAGDPSVEVANTKRFRGWAMDAVYLGDVHTVAIATDCRDLHFVSISTTSVFEEVHLFGFHSGLTALCYWHDDQRPERPSLLLLGDEKGGVHLMWFLNRSKGLFKKPSKKDSVPQRIFLSDLGEHSDMVSYSHIPNAHREPISRMMFEPSTSIIMSSSESDTTSVVCMNVTPKREPNIWKIKQGVKCFDYSASLQLMVTGGCDRAVRLWTRYVTTRPAATLLGHRTTVLDVAIYQPVLQIFSYSRDAELRVWDISTHQCLKTVRLHFPCLQAGQVPEHGRFPFLLVSPPLPEHTQPHLVVGCKDYLALLTLAEARGGGGGWEFGRDIPSGLAISCALYNPTLRQVVTGHISSLVSLWDVGTGRRQLQITNAHGEEDLTCMTLDSSHRRLITGARNGTIKVWNLLNGLNLHKLEPVTSSEVTGLACLHGNQLLAVGWSQRIAQYDIAAAKDLYVRVHMSWKSSGVHKSDILAVCHCSALGVAATASYDGEVVIWRLETQGPLLHLRRETPTEEAAAEEAASPVNSLLFLQHRASDRRLRNKGVLVSSQGGCLTFWSVTGQKRPYGRFYAPQQPRERVLSVSTDQSKNQILVSGDTAGWLQVWDISTYGLDIQREPACERPRLLLRWEAHKRELVSVEVLEVSDTLFVLTGSSDGSAGLWTKDGDHVGAFGQEAMWDITDQATYQRETQSRQDAHEQRRTVSGTSQLPDAQCAREECSQASTSSPAENGHVQPQQPMSCLLRIVQDMDEAFPVAASSCGSTSGRSKKSHRFTSMV